MDELTDFFTVEEGQRLFRFGQSDSVAAKACASACGRFAWDDDEECIDDSTVCCYNCRYRRWSPSSFHCMRRDLP